MSSSKNLTPVVFREWITVDDAVMGGVSRSAVSAGSDGVHFHGELSLANNGGFVSCRTSIEPLPKQVAGFRFEALGDGRRYQLRLRPGRSFDGVAWRAFFEPRAGRWESVELALSCFEPVYRGRLVRAAPTLGAREIGQLGLLLADGQPGAFALRVRALAAVVGDGSPRFDDDQRTAADGFGK